MKDRLGLQYIGLPVHQITPVSCAEYERGRPVDGPKHRHWACRVWAVVDDPRREVGVWYDVTETRGWDEDDLKTLWNTLRMHLARAGYVADDLVIVATRDEGIIFRWHRVPDMGKVAERKAELYSIARKALKRMTAGLPIDEATAASPA